MSSPWPIRTGWCVLSATALAVVAGCAGPYGVDNPPPPSHTAHFDEAMALRQWQRSTALYGNGEVAAGPTNSYYTWPVGDPADSGYMERQRLGLVAEPLVALGQFLALPVTMIIDPPIEKRFYDGVEIGPTYTAAVPPEELQRETRQGRENLQRAQRQQQTRQPQASPTGPATEG